MDAHAGIGTGLEGIGEAAALADLAATVAKLLHAFECARKATAVIRKSYHF